MGEEIMLERTGMAPLRFQGLQCTPVIRSDEGLPPSTRWFELRAFAVDAEDKFVIQASYRTRWEHERNAHVVIVVAEDDTTDVADLLASAFDVLVDPKAIGYPPTPGNERKQEALLARLRAAYQTVVSQILGSYPVFAEDLGDSDADGDEEGDREATQ